MLIRIIVLKFKISKYQELYTDATNQMRNMKFNVDSEQIRCPVNQLKI